MLDRFAARIRGDGGPEDPLHRRASDRALCAATSHHLEVARSRIEEVIGSCVRRESRDDLVETDDHRHFVPHHPTEIDALGRLRHHLEINAARFHAAMPPAEVRHAASPLDVARTDSLHRLDLALADRAGALARRFEAPDVRHDFLADLEADLSDFQRMLDERALLSSQGERRQVREHLDRTEAMPPAEGIDAAEVEGARPGRDEDPFLAFEEYREFMRQVDRRIAGAEGDPPLQGFWRDVKHKCQEEADPLCQRIYEESIPLSMLDV